MKCESIYMTVGRVYLTSTQNLLIVTKELRTLTSKVNTMKMAKPKGDNSRKIWIAAMTFPSTMLVQFGKIRRGK